jgi:hypothetical protein
MTTALAGQADLNSIEEASLRTRRAALRRLGLRRGLLQSGYSLAPASLAACHGTAALTIHLDVQHGV